MRRVKKTEDTYRDRLIENEGAEEIRCTSEIGTEGICYSDDIRKISGNFPYSAIKTAVCFEDLIVFYTKGIQMLFAFPKQLTEAEWNELLSMLSGNGIKIKKCSRSVL